MSNLNLPKLTYGNLTKLIDASKRDIITLAYKTTAEYFRNGAVLIRHHGNPIAEIALDYFTVDNAGWNSRTTSDRLNRVLRDNNADHYTISIKQGAMILTEYHEPIQTGNRAIAHIYTPERIWHFSRTTPTSPFIFHS